MSAQYDFEPGLNIIPITDPITKTQFIQMFRGLQPVDNIGGVIIMSGASGAHPDVTNNPRFSRFLWIDVQNYVDAVTAWVPILKMWQGNRSPEGTPLSDNSTDWVAIGSQDSAIGSDAIKDYACVLSKLSSISGSGVNTMLVVRPATVVDSEGNIRYPVEALTFSDFISGISGGKIEISLLAPSGVAGYVVANVTGGVTSWASLSDMINNLPAGSISASKVSGVASLTNYALFARYISAGVNEDASGDDSWNVVIPNAVKVNTIGISNDGTGKLGIPAGTYRIRARAVTLNSNGGAVGLFSSAGVILNDGIYPEVSLGEHTYTDTLSSDSTSTVSEVLAYLTFSVLTDIYVKTYVTEKRTGVAATLGTGFSGVNYKNANGAANMQTKVAEIEIWKLA